MPKQKLSPLPSAAFQILLALVGEDLHGYGIMRNVAQQTEGRMRLGPGTLYSSIRALLEEELIEEVDHPRDPSARDERRRNYRLTSSGRKLARSEAERLADLVISLPREYCYKRPDIATAPAKTCLNGTPTFFVFDTASPGRRPLLLGGLLSLITLVSFPRLMNEFGNFRPPSGWSFASPGAYERQGGDPQRPASGSEQGVQSPRGANPTLDATSRHRIIASAIASIKQHHIDPLEAQKAADALLAHERQGDDDSATSTEEFTRLATKQMREATGDHQLELLYSPRAIPERPSGPPPALPTAYRDEMRRVNCAFERVEILPHNVGYLKLNAFPDTS